MKRILFSALMALTAGAQAVPIAGQGTWETTLQSRDINSDGVADAYYDTDLNITWLADAKYTRTVGYTEGHPQEAGTVGEESPWVSQLNIGGVTGWRLPDASTTADDESCSNHGLGILGGLSCSFQANPADSEMAHLFYATLGNSFGSLSNTGAFLNLEGGSYHTGSVYTGQYRPDGAYNHFSFSTGATTLEIEGYNMYAWAVHDGDVSTFKDVITAPVPEPTNIAMMLVGLLGVWAVRRKAYSNNRR